jgi:starch phosphorylase
VEAVSLKKQVSSVDNSSFVIYDGEYNNFDITNDTFYGFPKKSIINAEHDLLNKEVKSVAYFSMEYGLATSIYNKFVSSRELSEDNKRTDSEVFSNIRSMDYFHMVRVDELVDMPIYSGGLGILAGDTLKAASDMGYSVVGIGVLWSKGYFSQKFCVVDGQNELEFEWAPEDYPGLIPLNKYVSVKIGDEDVKVKLWKYYVYSYDKKKVIPLILLDSNLNENPPWARELTGQLYKSDSAWWKIVQRKILGYAGMRALEVLGYSINTYHLNEGHAAFAFLERAIKLKAAEINKLKKSFAYTCHTPVEAGHDRLSISELKKVFDEKEISILKKFGTDKDNDRLINLTLFCMSVCNSVNAVAQKHGEVTKIQFPHYEEKIQSITNGIHIPTWASENFRKLFDKYGDVIGDWGSDSRNLKNVEKLKDNINFKKDLWEAHKNNKRKLTEVLKYWFIKDDVFTIAWARRATPYKRLNLILQYPEKLLELARNIGPIQLIFAGKAHPNDSLGVSNIQNLLESIDGMVKDTDLIKVISLENYDIFLGSLLTSSVDVWLNNPLPPFEASGTSGMKAILNGVVQLSTLDGWVVEAKDANIGRIFGHIHKKGEIGKETDLKMKEDAESLYKALSELMTLYYETEHNLEKGLRNGWLTMMINCVAQSGFFNTNRMVNEYNKIVWHI